MQRIPATGSWAVNSDGVRSRIYRVRNLMERFFNRIKHFRRIATRYDKLAKSFLSFVHLTCAFVWVA